MLFDTKPFIKDLQNFIFTILNLHCLEISIKAWRLDFLLQCNKKAQWYGLFLREHLFMLTSYFYLILRILVYIFWPMCWSIHWLVLFILKSEIFDDCLKKCSLPLRNFLYYRRIRILKDSKFIINCAIWRKKLPDTQNWSVKYSVLRPFWTCVYLFLGFRRNMVRINNVPLAPRIRIRKNGP